MVNTLVVDDDVDVLDFVSALLGRAHHDVTTAQDGFEAFDLLLNGRFDLCVLDHELPGLTGLEVASAFYASGKDTRILLMSGLARLKPELFESVDDFVSKPFNADEFLTIVDALIAP